jgi:hypothetical protein
MDINEMDDQIIMRLFQNSGKLNTQEGKDDCMVMYKIRSWLRLDMRSAAESFQWHDEFLRLAVEIDNA